MVIIPKTKALLNENDVWTRTYIFRDFKDGQEFSMTPLHLISAICGAAAWLVASSAHIST